MDDEPTQNSDENPLAGRRRLAEVVVKAPKPKLKQPRVSPSIALLTDKSGTGT